MVFDAFRKRNSHRAESSVTPLWRRGAAALAVGAVLGTTGVVGASAIDAPSAFAAEGGDSASDASESAAPSRSAEYALKFQLDLELPVGTRDWLPGPQFLYRGPAQDENKPVEAPKDMRYFDHQATDEDNGHPEKFKQKFEYKPDGSVRPIGREWKDSDFFDNGDGTKGFNYIAKFGDGNEHVIYVGFAAASDGEGSEEISAWEDSITVPSGQSVTYDAHEIPAGTVIDNEQYMKENLRVTRNSDGTLTIDATETPEGALGTMYFFHPDNPDQAFGMLTIEVQAPESEPKQSDDFDPKYTDTDLTQGDVSDAPTFDDPATDEVESAPEGTKFEKKDGPKGITVDEETGALVIGEDVPAGEHKVVVEVTYPDDSTDEVEVTVNVSAKPTADDYNPQYTENEFTQGDISSAPTFDDPTTDDVESAPEGTKFAPKSEDNYGLPEGVTVDPETGALTIAEDAEPGSYPIAVEVTYPDGSTDIIYETIVIKAKPEADNYNPQYTENEFTQGDISSAPTFDDPTTDEVESAPEGTKFAPKSEDNYGLPEGVTVDPETGALTIAEDAEPGSYPIAVEVTYPDGSTDIIYETIVIKAKPEADKYNPQYTDTTLKQGERSDAPTFDDPTTDAVEFVPEGTTFGPNEYSPLPEGITVDPETGEIIVAEDAEPGRYPIAVDVTYPDGSKDTIYETITVVGPTDAENLTPVYTDVTVERGETAFVDAPTFDDLATDEVEFAPEGTKFTLKDGEIEGVTIDEETGAISSNATFASPADHVYEVLVTYPDGSTDTTFVTIHVVETPQVKLYQPAYTEVTVTQGDVAEVAAPVFTDEETGEERDMPEGTTFALKDGDIEGVWIDEETGEIKSSATHAAPATNVYEVEVTYPDGSKETVVATVKVVAPEQATLYQPVYAPAEVERGQVGTIEAPKFTDEETGEERDMPEGTKFALNDGEIEGVTIDPETGAITVETTFAAVENVYEVLVTYPDGSSEVVVATINVIDTPVDEPGEQPGEGTEQPGEGTEEPGDGTDEPGDGTDEPGDGTDEPGDGTDEPGDGTEEPGDDAGEQPGDAGSSRPTKPVKVVPAKGGKHALPRTGAETGGLLAAAASLLAGGAALVTRRRKNEQ